MFLSQFEAVFWTHFKKYETLKVKTIFFDHVFQQPSSNYDDSGYFSIQVLQKAVEVFQLSLMPLNHPDELAKRTKHNPT